MGRDELAGDTPQKGGPRRLGDAARRPREGFAAGGRPGRCPDCGGRGAIPEKLKGPDGAKRESVACPRCRGEGEVDDG